MRRSSATRYKIKKIEFLRLIIHRTSKHIYAQIIEPCTNKVLVHASTLEKSIKKNLSYSGNKNAAITIGKIIAERALKKGIQYIAFDRSGFKYHGRIKELANSARKYGLIF